MEDYSKKTIFGSLNKSKIPANLIEYYCHLVVEEYLQGKDSQQVGYLEFTPRPGSSAEPFTVTIDHIALANHLVYSYYISEDQQQQQFVLEEKQEFKMQTSIKLAPKPASNLQEIQQQEDEYYPDQDIEIRMLQLADSSSSEEESSSKCMEPSQAEKGRIRAQLIQYFHIEINRLAKIKDIQAYLYKRGYKVGQARLKVLIADICKITSDKKEGYVLKQQYIERESYQGSPKKKIKE